MEAKIPSTLREIPSFDGEMTHFTFLEALLFEGLDDTVVEGTLKSPKLESPILDTR